jgi:hypothetical protein
LAQPPPGFLKISARRRQALKFIDINMPGLDNLSGFFPWLNPADQERSLPPLAERD